MRYCKVVEYPVNLHLILGDRQMFLIPDAEVQ